MTTQDIYAWAQMGLQILVGGGEVVGIYRYFGVLKRLIEGQEKTIATQAEQMKAQSTVLQDFDRLNTLMKRVIDTLSDPEALKREEAYRARVDRDANALLDKTAAGFTALIGRAMRYIPPAARGRLIEAVDLPPAHKETLKGLAMAAPDALNLALREGLPTAQILSNELIKFWETAPESHSIDWRRMAPTAKPDQSPPPNASPRSHQP